MQAKINSFFKPSSSCSSFVASVTSDTDDGLAVWENSQNAIVNTYKRRSATIDRNEVPKACIENGSSSASKDLNKKRNYTQFHLELGQSDFLLRPCVVCGVQYAPGDEADEKTHQSFHKTYVNGIPFKGWQNERAFTLPSFEKNRIVMVLESDSPAHKRKVHFFWPQFKLVLFTVFNHFRIRLIPQDQNVRVDVLAKDHNISSGEDLMVQEVVKLMENELGEDWILHKHCKVYLFVSSQRISGCLVAEPIDIAFKLKALANDETQLKKESSSPSTSIQFGNIVLQREVSKRSRASDDDGLGNETIVCEEETQQAVCGIRAIWVSPSNRRKGIATKLLDTTRESFCDNGSKLEKSQLAFSQPSSMGRSFGTSYFETSSFLVYKAPLIDTQFS